jgi:hypothetical protein
MVTSIAANPPLAKKMKEKRDRRRSSLIKSKGELQVSGTRRQLILGSGIAISSKFGFLKASKKPVPVTSSTSSTAPVPPLPKSSLGSHVADPTGGSSTTRKETAGAFETIPSRSPHVAAAVSWLRQHGKRPAVGASCSDKVIQVCYTPNNNGGASERRITGSSKCTLRPFDETH